MRNSDSEAFDIHFYNLKLEKMSTIVKLPLIKIIYFIINIFLFSIYKLFCQSLSSKVPSPTEIHGPPGPGTDRSKFDRDFQILVGSGPRFLDVFLVFDRPVLARGSLVNMKAPPKCHSYFTKICVNLPSGYQECINSVKMVKK